MTGSPAGGAALRDWLDDLLAVVDGLVDDVRYLAREAGATATLSADAASRDLLDLQRRLRNLDLEEP